MIFVLIVTLFLLLFVVTELCRRKFDVQVDVTRKIAHVVSGIFGFFAPYYITKWELIGVAVFFSAMLYLATRFNVIPSIHAVTRKTWGEVFFPLGIALSAFLFLPTDILAFQFGVLVLGISDAVAALIGMFYGKHVFTFGAHKKSLEGSLGFMITTLVIGVSLTEYSSYLVGVSALLTLVEFFLVFGLDNLVLPIAASFLFTLMP